MRYKCVNCGFVFEVLKKPRGLMFNLHTILKECFWHEKPSLKTCKYHLNYDQAEQKIKKLLLGKKEIKKIAIGCTSYSEVYSPEKEKVGELLLLSDFNKIATAIHSAMLKKMERENATR